MVEGAHKVLNDVPCNEGEALRRRFNTRDVIDWLGRTRIYLAGDSIRIGCEEGSDLPLQVREVFFGPFDF